MGPLTNWGQTLPACYGKFLGPWNEEELKWNFRKLGIKHVVILSIHKAPEMERGPPSSWAEILGKSSQSKRSEAGMKNSYVPKMKQLMPNQTILPKPITLLSSLLILHPPLFTLNPPPPILHSASFNFQPYSRGRSLTSKKPFFISIKTQVCAVKD